MNRIAFSIAGALLMAVAAIHGTALGATFEITPTIQAEIDKEKKVVASWALEAPLVEAVAAQNAKGPLAGMDNAKWKVTKRSDPLIKEFQTNAAGAALKAKLAAATDRYVEAFLSAAEGEKVAFVEKTTSYVHKGTPKFDQPFKTGQVWQGKAEFDESSQAYAVQLSAPVVSEGKTIGVLVVGLNLSHLMKTK